MVSAPVQPISGPFVPASADQPLDVGLHQQLQDALGHSTQKVTLAGLLQKLIQWQSVLGHRGLSGQCEVQQLHPRPPAAVTTPTPLPDRHVFPPPIAPEITPRPWTLPSRGLGNRRVADARKTRKARRVLAIALVLEGWSREAAAGACATDRQNLRDWVHRCNANGLKALFNQAG